MLALPILISVVVFGYSAAIILGYVYYYQKTHAQKPRARKVTIKTLLGNVAEADKTQFINKQQQTMKIITETKKKISEQTASSTSVPEQMTKKMLDMGSAQEAELIKEGAKLLKQMGSSAEPVSEEQRKSDMAELLKVASELGKMEKESPMEDVEELYSNVGYGLWMDTITQGLRKITADPNIRKYGVLQVEKLMSFLPRAFDPKDIRNALQLMKKSKEIVDLVELNPKTVVIAFTQETTDLKTAEKVLLAAIASEDEMTKQKVKMLFNWGDDFLDEVCAHLTALNILQIKGDKLVAEGLMTAKDRDYIKQKEAAKRASMILATPRSQLTTAPKTVTKTTASQPATTPALPKPAVSLPVVRPPSAPVVPSVPGISISPKLQVKPVVPPVVVVPAKATAAPGGAVKPPPVPAIPKLAVPSPIATAAPSPDAAAMRPAVKPLSAAKPLPPKTPALPGSAVKPAPASIITPLATPAAPSMAPAKPTPPVSLPKKPSVLPLPVKPKAVQALPKPTPVQAGTGAGEAADASKPAKYVQIGDITPINEAQRRNDMDDIMNAVMELERESTFSSGKEKPDLQVFDKEGKAVDNESLLSPGRIAPSADGAEVGKLTEKILAVYEKQEIVNGGVMQLKKLKALLDEEVGFQVDSGELGSTLEMLRPMGMISSIIDIKGGEKLVIFKKIELSAEEIAVIQLAISTPIADFTKDNIVKLLGVPDDEVLGTLKKLQEKGIIRFAGNSIQVPGVIQSK
nr:hypothetical protein [Candidatus Sigynarchaeum springense]